MSAVLDSLNPGQREAAHATEGPVLIIAGPGSGKTFTLVRRTMNILLQEKAKPEQIVLCTFTEKAALELRDRVRKASSDLDYTEDMSGLRVGTLHGIANEFVEEFRHRTPLANNYEVLDDMTQKLFLFDKFDAIVPEPRNGKYFGSWSSKWSVIEQLLPYFDKITEELIDPQKLMDSDDEFTKELGESYTKFESQLWESNKVDFAHLQKLFVHLLQDPDIGPGVIQRVKYVMVDEYQDTNYIQELIVKLLSSGTGNLCVVGDEDQSLYRFRGATVRNILEFAQSNPGCTQVTLTINYRSHKDIVHAYNKYMSSHNWDNPSGLPFRFNKEIVPNGEAEHPDYPSVISIWGTNEKKEAERFADFVSYLKSFDVIQDYSQVALLLYSVKEKNSRPYMNALEAKGIKSFCPRARAYFSNEEVQFLVGSLAFILDWTENTRGDNLFGQLKEVADYVDECMAKMAQNFSTDHPFLENIRKLRREVENVKPGKALDRRIADYVYLLMATEPFTNYVVNENRARNLATFSQLASIFQRYYDYTVITQKNLPSLRNYFFSSFLRFLYGGGINEYEDPDQPFPKDHVQIMTIHQSKGLEFPVVVVGSLGTNISVKKIVDKTLSSFYSKPQFEPEGRITDFDRMRLHYVAFSRPEKILALTYSGDDQPKPHFAPIWDNLPQWPNIEKEIMKSQQWELHDRIPPKKSYSFTGDLKVYETCPRQYEMYKFLEFAPSRAVMIFFGLLVHQTIEDIHRHQLEGKGHLVDEELIRQRFEFNYKYLLLKETRQIGQEQKEVALTQVLNYWRNNQDTIAKVIETEVDVTLEKDTYILNGAIDLVRGDDDELEVLDFKSQKRPTDGDAYIETYYKQLCIYAHILQERRGIVPKRLVIYWTAEEKLSDAVMEFPYNPNDVANAMSHFGNVVSEIQRQNFTVSVVPDKKVCNECDFRTYCTADGTITKKETA